MRVKWIVLSPQNQAFSAATNLHCVNFPKKHQVCKSDNSFNNNLTNNSNKMQKAFISFLECASNLGGLGRKLIRVAILVIFVWQGVYAWWFAAFSAHFVHLIIHFIQWIVYRKYVPVIVSTILSLPYCLYALSEFIHASLLSPSQICLWGLIGIVGMVLSVCSAFFIMAKVHRTSSRM